MTYKAFATIINLLSVIYPEYQDIGIIGQLNSFFNFDHNILLLHSSADINLFINTKLETPRSVYVFKSSDVNYTGLEGIMDIKSKNSFLIVAPENFDHGLNFIFRIREIQNLMTMKIGVFFSHFLSSEDLHNFFELCWTHGIINIFAAFHAHREITTLQFFSFNPFGTFKVINVTGSKAYDTYFLSQNSNFQQHILRVAEPAFTFITSKSDETLWLEVFRLLNASSTEIESDFNVDSRSEFFEKNSVDIVTNVFGVNPPTIVNTYPIAIHEVVIVVPESLPYGEFSSYLRTVTSDNFFSYSIIIIVAVMLQLSLFRYVRQKKILLLQSIADVVNLLMNDNGGIKYQHLSRIEAFLILPLTFAGFVIVNGILSNLQSYLTRPIIQPQINTVDDIYRSPFRILTNDEYWAKRATNILENILEKGKWNEKVVKVDLEVLESNIYMYNTSISFLSKRLDANILLDVQKRLNIRGYHISQLHINKLPVSYPVHANFPFVERINEIIHWIQNAGLYIKWLENDLSREAKRFYKKCEHLKNRDEIDIEGFPVPSLIFYGWFTGIVVFVIEILWKNLILSRMINKRKPRRQLKVNI